MLCTTETWISSTLFHKFFNTNLIDIDNDLVLVGTSLDNSSEIFKKNIGLKFDNIENIVVKSFLMNEISSLKNLEKGNDEWFPIKDLNEEIKHPEVSRKILENLFENFEPVFEKPANKPIKDKINHAIKMVFTDINWDENQDY